MNSKSALVLTACATLATPLSAWGQSASSTVLLQGQVDEACSLGLPQTDTLDLQDLTGPDGRIDAAMRGPSVLVSTIIPIAWCNTSNILSIDAAPLELQAPPAWAVGAGFSRLATYDATLVGWSGGLTDRPLVGSAPKTLDTSGAQAATGSGLVLEISNLETLDAAGTVEDANLVLEAGSYSGAVVISLGAN